MWFSRCLSSNCCLSNGYQLHSSPQAFRDEVALLRPDVRLVNELSAELTPLDIQLSSTASRQLDQLNMRWKLLQVPEGLLIFR